jgi:hypothetical protein
MAQAARQVRNNGYLILQRGDNGDTLAPLSRPSMTMARSPLLVLLLAVSGWAQVGRGGWTTFGGDRNGRNRTENELTSESVKNLKLEGSLKLDSPPKELTGLTAPLARATMATPHGGKNWW